MKRETERVRDKINANDTIMRVDENKEMLTMYSIMMMMMSQANSVLINQSMNLLKLAFFFQVFHLVASTVSANQTPVYYSHHFAI